MIPPRGYLVPALVAVLLMAVCAKARANDPPQLPPGVTCELVRAMVAEHGKVYSYAWAKLNGYSAKEIEAARKCLR